MDDELVVYACEFVWPLKDKPNICNALRWICKNHDEDMKFNFDVSKCDRFFNAFLKEKVTRIPPCLTSFWRNKTSSFGSIMILSLMPLMIVISFDSKIQSAVNDE